jgi:hypothetical protein
MPANTHDEVRAAESQALLRHVNERIEALNQAFDDVTPFGSWACECPDTACRERIELTTAEYEALRAHPNRFAVAPGEDHVWPNAEHVVERKDRYWVVAKDGAAAERAKELDPRSAE